MLRVFLSFFIFLTISSCELKGLPFVDGNEEDLSLNAIQIKNISDEQIKNFLVIDWNDLFCCGYYEISENGDEKEKFLEKIRFKSFYVKENVPDTFETSYIVKALDVNDKLVSEAEIKLKSNLQVDSVEKTELQDLKNPINQVKRDSIISWNKVDTADFYYLKVISETDNEQVIGSFTKETNLKLEIEEEADSNLPPALKEFLPAIKNGMKRGIVYNISVTTIKKSGNNESNTESVIINESDSKRIAL